MEMVKKKSHDPSCDNYRQFHDPSCDNLFRYELSVGIDFGTSHCAVAYSYEEKQDEVHVFTNWPDGTPTLGKIPTAILFDKDKKCLNFGYGALKQFKELVDKEEHEDTYFFCNFKMQLYQEKNIKENMLITDISGKQMKALDVFSASVRYMKETLLSDINHRRSDLNISDRVVRWVITVPAIWCDAARQFMRKAAEKAGCHDRSIVIALEPEAASIYCRNSKSKTGEKNNAFKMKNSKYLVIDNGGGTLDVTAHEVIEENHLKELFRASGGDLGGNKVDEHFITLLTSLFSEENIKTIREEFPEEWIRVLQEFDTIKKELNLETNKEVSISLSNDCPWNKSYFSSLPDNITKGIKLTKRGRLFLPSLLIINLVEKVSEKICSHIASLLQKDDLKNLDCIIMVGGFSNSRVVVNGIKRLAKESSIQVIVPEQTELCVVMGAAIFGWKQDIIRSRKARRTYGFRVNRNFVEGIHEEKRAYYDMRNYKKCDDCIDILIRINEDIPLNHKIVQETTHPYKAGNRATVVKIYSSDDPNPKYTDEEGVSLIGEFKIPRSGDASGKTIHKEVYFGGTEIKVVVTDEASGKIFESNFDFLSHNFVKLLD